MQVKIKAFNELNTKEYHQLLFLRVAVFVVEQNCPYQEVDAIDLQAMHLWLEEEGRPVAYARVYEEDGHVHFGRVLVEQASRHQGLGKKLLDEVLQWVRKNKPNQSILISAQYYLRHFYGSFGFQESSSVYLEDGIKHIEMKKTWP
ncbi:MAG TPA: GNAT family N-acetyltransferase [Candidatus Tetragenococcus pullicola]|nr:GNAT family N-acetyltransferase [Candidatus Tetragenococcus pullicola]